MYRPENTRKWIMYDNGGEEPVAEHENINNKRHDPDREWFVVDRPADHKPKRLAPEAFHARHGNEEYMQGIIPPKSQHARRKVNIPRDFSDPKPQHARPEDGIRWPDPGLSGERFANHYPTFVADSPRKASSGDERERDGYATRKRDQRTDPAPQGLTGHAAVDLSTGRVRILDNGFDPNKLPAPPAPIRTEKGWVMPSDQYDEEKRRDAPDATQPPNKQRADHALRPRRGRVKDRAQSDTTDSRGS